MTAYANDSTTEQRGSWKLYLIGVSGLLALAGLVFLLVVARSARAARELVERRSESTGEMPTQVARAETDAGSDSVTLTGDVKPFRRVALLPKIDGYLNTISVEKGDDVRAGQLIGVIQQPDAEQRYRSASATLKNSAEERRRIKELASEGLVSKQDLDRAERDLQIADAEASRLRADKNYQLLRAPFSGTVVARHADPGALMIVPATVDAIPIVEIWDTRRVRVQVNVAQAEAALVHVGTVARVWSDERAKDVREERVTRTSRALDPRSRTMAVELEIDNRDHHLLAGAFVHVQLALHAPAGVRVPVDAVTMRKGETVVAVVRERSAAFRPVQLGRTDGRFVRILSGVAAGEIVALFPSDDLIGSTSILPIFPNGSSEPPVKR